MELPSIGLSNRDVLETITTTGEGREMLEYLEKEELDSIIARRPRLGEKLDEWRDDGIKVDLWMMEEWAGRKPLALLARLTFKTFDKQEYKFVVVQNEKVYTWNAPAVMPGATKQEKSHGGRPAKYGREAAERAKALRDKRLSIREIAKELGASTYTVQKLLKSTDKPRT